jgi:hypothetical protein
LVWPIGDDNMPLADYRSIPDATAPAIDCTADRDAQETALRSAHLAILDQAVSLTDMIIVHASVKRLRRQLRHATLGEMGRNGMAPQIESVLKSAQFHGMDWRERAAASIGRAA